MIFYTLRQWLSTWVELFVWLKSQPSAAEQILEGKIDAVIEPGKVWRVRHLATFWMARTGKPAAGEPVAGKPPVGEPRDFAAGDYIKIVGRKGLVLFIEPFEPGE